MLVVEPMAFTESPGAALAGTLLAFGQEVADDRVPREGRRLRREQVVARWTDGHIRVWRRRQASVGRGEGSSGLRFDDASHGPPRRRRPPQPSNPGALTVGSPQPTGIRVHD